MAKAFICCSWMTLPTALVPLVVVLPHQFNLNEQQHHRQKKSPFTPFASKSGGFSLNSFINKCQTCGGQGAVECPGCKGSGKNKKNGNIFERWKCYDCQGFGLKTCPSCGQGRGLTPEQRGER